MDSPLPPPPPTTTAAVSTAATGGAKTLADLDEDAVAHCAGFLGLRDLASLAMTCRGLRRASYSDLIWSPVYRERWPEQFFSSGLSQVSGIREKYLARRIELQQFKFLDPSIIQLKSHTIPPSHILIDRNCIIVAQGSILQAMKTYTSSDDFPLVEMPREHNARITCARLFPLRDTFLFRSEAQIQDNVLVTSSCDHTIRLWWKGCSQRCFRGHNGPVTTLADKLLGDANAKFLASGGEDGTVRLWSFCTSGKRHALKATFYGHQKPITALSVAGHKPSLLVSISQDAKGDAMGHPQEPARGRGETGGGSGWTRRPDIFDTYGSIQSGHRGTT
ncbi:hypothetical protein QJS04_geneDACA021398 [Acorus gramineus]|uniref:Uncharacterized protein n=1 Tax=Acorus gramineus TaxID=55184 RepID=A0AAV9A5G1_ACOGR|nr:hypothetical protein QJS04_geneDACA021398 [Acorus gramineus]